MAPKLAIHDLHTISLQGFMNFIDNKLPNVTKSSVDKSFRRLVKKILESTPSNSHVL